MQKKKRLLSEQKKKHYCLRGTTKRSRWKEIGIKESSCVDLTISLKWSKQMQTQIQTQMIEETQYCIAGKKCPSMIQLVGDSWTIDRKWVFLQPLKVNTAGRKH